MEMKQNIALTKEIFISYAEEDEDIALELNENMELHKQKPWFSKRQLRGGQEWEDIILQKINSSDFFVFLISENSNTALKNHKRYLKKELDYAIKKNKKIIPVKMENVEIPSILKKYHIVDFSKDKNYKSLYISLGIGDIHDKYSFLEGYWIGYTIENSIEIGGKKEQIYPILSNIKIVDNMIIGKMMIHYMGIGDTPIAELKISAIPREDVIECTWENIENESHRGTVSYQIRDQNKITGHFTASKTIDTKKVTGGEIILSKIALQDFINEKERI